MCCVIKVILKWVLEKLKIIIIMFLPITTSIAPHHGDCVMYKTHVGQKQIVIKMYMYVLFGNDYMYVFFGKSKDVTF